MLRIQSSSRNAFEQLNSCERHGCMSCNNAEPQRKCPYLCAEQVMVLSQDREKGRVALSTRKLERTKGDMLRDPQKVRYSICLPSKPGPSSHSSSL